MLQKLYKRSSYTASDLPSFQRQETVFIILNLGLLIALLVVHALCASFLGRPSRLLVAVLGAVFLANGCELVWVRRLTKQLNPIASSLLTWGAIGLNLAAAGYLTVLSDHEDSPYFTLAVIPVLLAAFRLSLPSVVAVVGAASFLNFAAIAYFYQLHPPADFGEYFEVGISTLVFAMVGLLVWLLVAQIREHENNLARNLLELKQARAKLLEEETLAAVGRLSSAIAHEIRNPVAMISSSLQLAKRSRFSSEQQDEMCEIASREAERLEKLTGDFLSYARPRVPKTTMNLLHDTLAYVSSVCRAHAGDKQVKIDIDAPESLRAELDPAQVQQALLNLVMNAIDASPQGGTVRLKAGDDGVSNVKIWVTNSGAPIPEPALSRIFEPFFTTKARGTGLGLAIARNIARSHGGELVISSNQPDNIGFCLRLPAGNSTLSLVAKD